MRTIGIRDRQAGTPQKNLNVEKPGEFLLSSTEFGQFFVEISDKLDDLFS